MTSTEIAPAPSQQVNLHQHSERSFLDGEAKIKGIVKRAKDNNQVAAVLTDHEEVNGHIELQAQCRAENIKPIFGMEGYFHPEGRRAKEVKLKATDYSHITLLAQNNEGLKNLWSWSTRAYTENFYYKAVTDWEQMKEYSSGLYASDGCLLSHMAGAIVADDTGAQHELMGRYLDTFDERFFMELHTWQFMDPQEERQVQLNADMTKVNQRKAELAKEYSVPLVIVNDAHYANPEDWKRHNLVWAMKTQDTADQTGAGRTAAWLMDEAEAIYWMERHGISEAICREAFVNAGRIAADCNAEIVSRPRMPQFKSTSLEDIRHFVDSLEEGFRRKVIGRGLPEGPYRARMEREARMICKKGFPGYFNVVSDYVRWAKYTAGMFIGPGRGSAGGSLCAWLLDITEMDPLKYDLLFERFISDDREDWPDIDTDFPKSRLPEIKTYLSQTYGADKVCQMGTLTRTAPKSMLKDIGTALQVSYSDKDAITKAIGKIKPNTTYDDMMHMREKELNPWVQKYPELFQRASEMVGMVRQAGTHPSGFIVSSEPILGNLPLRMKQKQISAAFEMNEVEWLGFIKFDLLGIRHCDTIASTCAMIERRHGKKIDPYTFGDDEFGDPAIWESVGRGDCLGIFQLDADLMTQTAKRFKPTSEMDVAELLAVNRPGVIDAGLVTPYIERKHGREEITFDHPMMEELVGDTYGILIFQEQIMKMSQKVAGFTPTEAEKLRKIVGKKQVEKLPALRKQFFDGCHANEEFIRQCSGNPEVVIEKIWSSVEASGSYLFNKSHSVAYALTASWEAWFRHYYYPEFITSTLATDDDDDQMPRYVRHAQKRGLNILPPDINLSGERFSLGDKGDDDIRYGLTSVKMVGDTAYAEIAKHKPFENFEDMMERVTKRNVNKAVVLNLIHIGAFDSFNPSREEVEREYYEIMRTKDADRKEIPDYTDELEMYRLERSLVGSSILYDPLRPFADMVEGLCVSDPEELDELSKGDVTKVGGLVTAIRKTRVTRGPNKGAPMAFLTITYQRREFEVVAFSDAWMAYRNFIEEDMPVIASVIKTDRGVHLGALQRLDLL